MRCSFMKFILLSAVTLLLTACGSNRTQNYYLQYSEILPPVVTPPGTPDPISQSYYPVPPGPRSVVKPPLTPPGSNLETVPVPAAEPTTISPRATVPIPAPAETKGTANS